MLEEHVYPCHNREADPVLVPPSECMFCRGWEAALENETDLGRRNATGECIKAASNVVQELVAQQLSPYKTTLIAGGGIAFLFKHEDLRADIECYNDGKMLYTLTGHYVEAQIEYVTDLSAAVTAVAEYVSE